MGRSLDDVVTTVVPTVVPAGTPELPSGAWYANPSADFTLGSTVVVNEAESLSASRRLVLSGTPVLSYTWSVDGGALNLSAPGIVSGSLVSDMLVIRAGVLSPGESYGFRLVATAVDSILETVLGTATTVITVLTNSPPAGGALAVTPANGTELETVFNVAANGWTDDAGDLPLSYSFSRLPGRFPVSVPQLWFPTAVTDAAGDVLDFQALSGALSVGSLATMLPAGDLVDGGATTVQVLVSDAFGAVSSVASVVNVTLNTTGLPIDVPSLEDVVTTLVPTVVPAGTPKLPNGTWYANPSADFTLGSTVVVNETEPSASSRRLVRQPVGRLHTGVHCGGE